MLKQLLAYQKNLFFCTCGVGYDAKVSKKALHQKKREIMMYAKNMIDVEIIHKGLNVLVP